VLGGGRAALWGAVILSSILFGAAHANQGMSGVIQAGVGGLVLSVTYVLSKRNLWPCIIAHTLTDSMAFTMIFFGGAKLFTG
jgi:membrane protease YdiL (CAAX protease family)